MSKKPTVLMILDGYGLSDKTEGNAVKQAKTPVMDKLIAKYPFVQGEASGMAVGLPDGQMGNSEVGHTNMGAGRIVYQMLVKISKSIQDGDFFENKALVAAMENCKKNDSALHLMGLLSPGGVHSHMEHLYGLLEMAKKNGLEKVYVHAYLDGRDVPPSSAAEYMEELVAKIKEIGVGSVATISGRFYAMDRDNAWDREEKAYSALVYGEGVQADDPVQAIKDSYANDVTDEFMLPTVVDKNGMSDKWVDGNDGWAYYNEMIGVNGHTENFLTSITLKNSADVVGTDIKNFYYTTAATEPDKTSIGTDSKTQWVKISEEEFKALDDENNNIKATFKRAEVKSNGLYDNAEYTLTITAQVSQANKEAAATWITDATNQTVKNFLNGLPTVNN